MRPSIISPLLALLLGLAASHASGQPPARTLRWSLAEGQRLDLYLVQTTTTQIGREELAERYATAAAMNLAWLVEQVRVDGTAQLACRLQRFRFKVLDQPSPPPPYDSADPDSAGAIYRQLDESLRGVLGKPFRVALSPRGQLEAIEPPGAAAESDVAAGQSRPAVKQPAAGDPQGTAPAITAGSLVAWLQQALGKLPEAAVREGQSWDARRTVDSPFGSLLIESRFTSGGLTSRADAPAESRPLIPLRLDGRVSRVAESAENAQPLGESRLSGRLLFDAVAGRLVESQTILTIRTTLTVNDQPLPVRSESRLTLTIAPPSPAR